MPGHLCFVHAVTTGLNPRLDPILELAIAVVDEKNLEVVGLSLIINPALGRGGSAWEDRLDDDRKRLLSRSGLLREVPYGVSPASAEEAMIAVLTPFDREDRFISAGYSPATHLNFLREQMGSLHRRFRADDQLDVVSVRTTLKRGDRSDLIPEIAASRRHRAWEDLQDAVSEMRIYNEYLATIPRWA